jgi:signal transduction histidine kinase
MPIDREKVKLYIQIKWAFLAAIGIALAAEILLVIADITFIVSALLGVFISALINLANINYLKRGEISPLLIHSSLILDLLLMVFTLYINGGMENTWLFFPAMIIFVTGYLFNLEISIGYASLSLMLVIIMFLLEYFLVIPHFHVYNLPEFLWRSLPYSIDYLIGMALLYFSSALASGYFNRYVSENTRKLEAGLKNAETSKSEINDSRRALLNIMDDLNQTKGELELKVKQRTTELEEAKIDLENKVAERTVKLEESRTAVLHMMRDLKEDIAKLQSVDKMKTEFLSMVSHELRTPLTPIKGYLSLLQSGKMGALTDQQKNALEIVTKQSEHLHSLIDSVLDLSRLELGKPIPIVKEPVSVNSILLDTYEAMRIQAENQGLKILLNIQEELPTIMGDAAKLKRILANLLGNAIKFTPRGGEITLRAFSGSSNIRIEVADNGIGLSSEHREKIFEKFFQVDSSLTRSSGGMGMGLTIVRELVTLHGGVAWAESEGLGKGSKFIFSLPVTG